jgi:hypothetical protein
MDTQIKLDSIASSNRDELNHAPPPQAAPLVSQGTPAVAISADRWGDLAIGIDGYGDLWLFAPPPQCGQVVSLKGAYRLPIRGRVWRQVVKLFAETGDVRTVSKADLVRVLCLPEVGDISNGQAKYDELLTLRAARWIKHLRSTMADLKRQFLRHTPLPYLRDPLFESEGDDYRIALTVRFLKQNDKNQVTFGEPASQ